MENKSALAERRSGSAVLSAHALSTLGPSPALDRIVRLAASLFDMPIAVVSVLDDKRQFTLASYGPPLGEVEPETAFCAHTLSSDGAVVVPDTVADRRFCDNPLVTGDPSIRFYAGIPLCQEGQRSAIATLSLMDTEPRDGFSAEEMARFQELAALVVDIIEGYDAAARQRDGEADADAAGLGLDPVQLQRFFQQLPIAMAMFDLDMTYLAASASWLDLNQLGQQDLIGRNHDDVMPYLPDEWRKQSRLALDTGALVISENVLPLPDGPTIWVRRTIVPWHDRHGGIGGVIKFFEDITDAKLHEQEKEHNRIFLESVLANIRDGIVACNEDAELILFNRAAQDFHGKGIHNLPPAEWADHYDLFHADGTTLLERDEVPLFRAWKGATVADQEIVIAPKQGERKIIICHAAPMHDRDGQLTGAVATMTDVTAEREARAEAMKAEILYRAIFNQTFQLCVVLDTRGYIIEANDAVLELTGRTREALTNKPIWMHNWWPSRANLSHELEVSFRRSLRGEFVRYNVDVQDRNGRVVPIDFSLKPVFDGHGNVTTIIAEGRDITEQRQQEARINEQKDRFRLLYDETPVMMYSIDATGCLISVSNYWLRVMGYDRNEVIGRRSVDFLTPESRKKAVDEVLPAFFEKGECRDVEYQMVKKDGELIEVLLSAIAMYDEGQFQRSLAVMTDVTDRKAVEYKLVQAQKMEMVGQLTGGLAHDFNNLLSVVMGNLQLLEREVETTDKTSRQITAALDAAERGAELTRRLLAFSRRQKLESSIFEPNQMIRGLRDLLTSSLGEHIKLQVSLMPDIANVVTDRAQLESAILNLAVNARDAMPNGGNLTIESAETTITHPRRFQADEILPGNYVVISVIDTGVGIPRDKIASVFEPFFTTKAVGKGSGLGLSMIYGLMRQSGGYVQIDSVVGCGTTVRLYLPAVTERADRAAEPVKSAGLVKGAGEIILVVEDQDAVRDVAVGLIEELGYTVLKASSGPEAMEIVSSICRIDLLFTDIVMPGGMDGPTLAIEARKLRPELPVIFTTGYADASVLRKIRSSVNGGVVTKPYRRDDLAEKISIALDKKTVSS